MVLNMLKEFGDWEFLYKLVEGRRDTSILDMTWSHVDNNPPLNERV